MGLTSPKGKEVAGGRIGCTQKDSPPRLAVGRRSEAGGEDAPGDHSRRHVPEKRDPQENSVGGRRPDDGGGSRWGVSDCSPENLADSKKRDRKTKCDARSKEAELKGGAMV